jgi:hypothetical protein
VVRGGPTGGDAYVRIVDAHSDVLNECRMLPGSKPTETPQSLTRLMKNMLFMKAGGPDCVLSSSKYCSVAAKIVLQTKPGFWLAS